MADLQFIADNLAAVRQRIADAARRSGRAPGEVQLVAVTKYADPAEIEALLQAGCRDLGESRPQQLWQRAEAFGERDVRWHLVGHLQRNKVPRTLRCVELIHSADSMRLLQAIDEAAAANAQSVRVLLEVNVSGDTAKHGFQPDEITPLLPELAKFSHVGICGLMTLAAREGGLDVARRNFADLRALRDRLAADAPEAIKLRHLSMGMSGDYKVAVEEGATIVRIGSALFEQQP